MQRHARRDPREESGNDDGNWTNPIAAGETRTIAALDGPAVIRHIWITIATPEKHHLKKIVLRMYWDDESEPSIEAPVGDFLASAWGSTSCTSRWRCRSGRRRRSNTFFPMPFHQSARLDVTKEGSDTISAFYYNIDYERHARLPGDIGYFHAQYRQAAPNDPWTTEWTLNGDDTVNNRRNPDGEDNYVILDADGRGHYVGVTWPAGANSPSGTLGSDIRLVMSAPIIAKVDAVPGVQGLGGGRRAARPCAAAADGILSKRTVAPRWRRPSRPQMTRRAARMS